MARNDIGLATAMFATFLGSDPILVGATEEQKQRWLGAIAEEGMVFAYGATEPEAGSDLGAMKTTAVPIETDGEVTGYRINGRKQWISNGIDRRRHHDPGPRARWPVLVRRGEGHAGLHERAARGQARHPTVEHRRAVPRQRRGAGTADRRGRGQGLVQAQQVFGYTRVMVAAFGLGGGWEALDRAIEYSKSASRRAPAGGEAGLHAQADRPARRAPRGGPRVHRGDRRRASTRRGETAR